jgi:intracellular septation protein
MAGKKKSWFPFTAEQSVNILSEFGPLVTLFVVNAIYSKTDPELFHGTVALIGSTFIAMIAMWVVLHRLPVFPLIASSVTVVFGLLTIYTHNPMWVQIKVTIFNVLFGAFLLLGLYLKQNFFKYVFEKTFHYSEEGWNKFTFSFALFFFLTAILNEVVRQSFKDTQMYDVFGHQMNGVNIWILFKVAIIMPLSGLYAWFLTRVMQKYRIEDPEEAGGPAPALATAARRDVR